ncbi:FUSC family protein [Arthrobacter sp. PAMC25564]|uniref:FUSC family protein n=1 Tax=Arthrobacter sp. PAMC25564 TaxID=2565366 RepID=UPI0010A22DF3|nr:FUSC family protein [Arthrobacter sp. PAMC25564]QCB97876.1 FUSC family protein [Arthrobacter sp. PAMC25564]
MRQYAREFFHVPPARGHRMPALRVAIGIVIPLLALVLMGRTDLTIYALLGALTGVYGRVEPHWLRLKHQSFAGIIMCASVIGGVTAAAAGLTGWSLIVLSTAVAGALSLVADRLHLRPAGPFFFLFAFTASASIPFRGPLWQAAAAAAVSVAVVLLLGFSGRLRARRSDPQRSLREPAHPPWPRMLKHAGRYVLAIGLAGSIATLAGLGHSYWAMVAAAAPIAAADATHGLIRAVHRTLGTYGGVLLTACLLAVNWSPLQLAVLLAVLQFVGEVFVVRHYSIALVWMTPVALMMTEFVAPKPAGVLVTDRAMETTLGAGIAFLVILLTTRQQRRKGPENAAPMPDRTGGQPATLTDSAFSVPG